MQTVIKHKYIFVAFFVISDFVPAKFVPKLLNFEQKQCRMDIAQEMLTMFNDDPKLLKKIITGDKSNHATKA